MSTKSHSIRDVLHHGEASIYQVVMLGESGVGKTTMIQQLLKGNVVHTHIPPTEDELTYHICDPRPGTEERLEIGGAVLAIRDTGGHLHMTDDVPNAKDYVAKADGIILCFSMADRDNYQRMLSEDYLDWIIQETKGRPTPPILLCGTKVTKPTVSKDEAEALAKKLQCPFTLLDDLDVKVRHAFYVLASMIYEYRLNPKPFAYPKPKEKSQKKK